MLKQFYLGVALAAGFVHGHVVAQANSVSQPAAQAAVAKNDYSDDRTGSFPSFACVAPLQRFVAPAGVRPANLSKS